jgi:hypothetical protein
LVFVEVMAPAVRPQVGLHGGAAVGVVVGVVQVAAPGRAPAADVAAGAVADFDVAAQRGVGEPVLGVVVQVGEQPVAVRELRRIMGGEMDSDQGS